MSLLDATDIPRARAKELLPVPPGATRPVIYAFKHRRSTSHSRFGMLVMLLVKLRLIVDGLNL